MASTIGEAFVVVRPDTKGFAAEADKNISGALGSTFANVTKMAAAAAAAGGVALAGLGAWGLKSAADMQQVEIAFEGIFQSGTKSKQFLDQLRDFAAKTPFEFPELATAAKQLLAVGFNANEVIPIMTKLGNVAAVLGVGGEAINGVVRALGQMQGKGKASAEELQQISEQIPGFSAIKAIAEDMGVTVAEAFDQMSKGAIPASRAINAILAGMEKFPGAAGAMERQSKTLNGVLSTLKDTARDALISGIAPILPAIANAINGAVPKIKEGLTSIGTLTGGVLQTLVGFADKLLGPLTKVLDLVGRLANVALDELGGILDAIGPDLNDFIAAFGKFAETALRQLGPALQQILPALLRVGTTLATQWLDILIALTPAIEIFATALATVLEVLGPLGVTALIVGKQVSSLVGHFMSLQKTLTGPMSISTGLGLAIGAAVGLAVAWNQLLGPSEDIKLSVEALANKSIPQLTERIDRQRFVASALAKEWDRTHNALEAGRPKVQITSDLHKQFNDVLAKAPESAGKFIDAIKASGRETDYYSGRLADHIVKQALARTASDKFSDAVDRQAKLMRTAYEKATDYADATFALEGSQLAAEVAISRANEAIDTAGKTIDDTTTFTNEFKDAQDRAKESILLAASAAGETARKQAELRGETNGAEKATAAQITTLQAFRDTLAPGNPLRVWIEDLLTKFGNWPTSLTTTVVFDTSAARAEAQRLASLFATFDPAMQERLNAIALVDPNAVQFASGGRVNAPPGQAVPAILHGQEVVLNQEQQADVRELIGSGGPSYEFTFNVTAAGDPVDFVYQSAARARVAMYAAGLS